MANSSKRKGDRAELEVQGLLRDLLGVPARRALGAGRLDDMGDISGVPQTVVQVADWKDALRAIREKPLEADRQRQELENSRPTVVVVPEGMTYHEIPLPTFTATFVRLKGGVWRVIQTPEQWAAMWREAV